MKRLNLFIILFFCVLHSFSQGYKIKVKISGLKNEELQFAYYYEDKQYVVQSQNLTNGEATLQDTAKLLGGIYLFVVPEKAYFDVLITDDQDFSLKTDTLDLVDNMKVTGSIDNEVFYEYQKQMSQLFKQNADLEKQLQQHYANTDSATMLSNKIDETKAKTKNAWREVAKKYPNAFFTKLLKAMNSAEDEGNASNGRFYDNIDFSEPRFIRTPILYKSVRMVIAETINQSSDSINYALDRLLSKAKANTEVYKYVLGNLATFYNSYPKIGMNEVFVHLAETYFLTDPAYLADTAGVAALKRRIEILKSSFVGHKAADIKLETLQGEMSSVYSLNAKYTLVFFWTTDCGHCKEATNSLKAFYEEVKGFGTVEIFAVFTRGDKEDWKKYVEENDLDWIQCWEPTRTNPYYESYNVYSTPILYLLDQNKIILSKCVGPETIKNLTEQLLQQKERLKVK